MSGKIFFNNHFKNFISQNYFIIMTFSEEKFILLFANKLEDVIFLETLLKNIKIYKVYAINNFDEAVDLIKKNNFNVALISISSSGLNDGISLAELIKANLSFPFIFLTDDYNMNFYQSVRHLKPHAFMSKKLNLVQLIQALESVFNISHISSNIPKKDIFLNTNYIFVKKGNHFKKIVISEILWVESKGKYCSLQTEKIKVLVDLPIRDLSTKLEHVEFIRVHKSYLVNLRHIDFIDKANAIVNIMNKDIPIGRSFKNAFFNRIKFF